MCMTWMKVCLINAQSSQTSHAWLQIGNHRQTPSHRIVATSRPGSPTPSLGSRRHPVECGRWLAENWREGQRSPTPPWPEAETPGEGAWNVCAETGRRTGRTDSGQCVLERLCVGAYALLMSSDEVFFSNVEAANFASATLRTRFWTVNDETVDFGGLVIIILRCAAF